MPELPDISAYLDALDRFVVGRRLLGVRLASAFLLRSVDPPLAAGAGRKVLATRRIGKRIVFALEEEIYFVLHLMIAGRLRWRLKADWPRTLEEMEERRSPAARPDGAL